MFQQRGGPPPLPNLAMNLNNNFLNQEYNKSVFKVCILKSVNSQHRESMFNTWQNSSSSFDYLRLLGMNPLNIQR